MIYNLIINYKNIYNLFALKSSKILKKMLKIANRKNFEGPLKLNEVFSSKAKVIPYYGLSK